VLLFRAPSPPLRLLQALGEQAEQSDALQGEFGRVVRQRVGAGVPQREDHAREEVHQALLLVAVGLIGEVIKARM